MVADLVAPDGRAIERIEGGETWKGELPAGSYVLRATTREPNNRFDYTVDVAATGGDVAGLAFPDTPANQTSGYIVLDHSTGLTDHVIAHELFHLVQFGIWQATDGWLLESTAEWTGFRFEGFNAGNLLSSLGAPDMSLDCIGDKCGNDDYERGGYSRWSFFEYLNEHFGSTIVKDVLDRGAALGDPTVPAITLVSDVLAAKGTTLANAFTDWTVAKIVGEMERSWGRYYDRDKLRRLYGPDLNVPALRTTNAKGLPHEQVTAMTILGEKGDRDALPLIEHELKNAYPLARFFARAAIEKITGEPCAADLDAD